MTSHSSPSAADYFSSATTLFAIWSGVLADAERLITLVVEQNNRSQEQLLRVVIVVRLPHARADQIVAAAGSLQPLLVATNTLLGVNVGGPERGCSPAVFMDALAPLQPSWVFLPERAEAVAHFRRKHVRILRSCHDHAGLESAFRHGVDACTLSPVWPTNSKPDGVAVGVPALRQACQRWPDQIVALGGIDADQVPSVFAAGAVAIAALSASWGEGAADLVQALRVASV